MINKKREDWKDTLEISSDADTLDAIRRADEDLARGHVFSFEKVFGYPQPQDK